MEPFTHHFKRGDFVICLVLSMLWVSIPEVAAQDWPMFQGSQQLRGVQTGRLGSGLERLWLFPAKSPVKSSTAVVSNMVYFGVEDGQFHCVKLADGKPAWSFKTEGSVESSPLVLEGRVYFGSGDGHLYCLDAASGKLLWKYATEDRVLGSPNWARIHNTNFILFGGYDYKLHSVEAATGRSNWVYETSNYINGAPGVDGSLAVFGGCDGLLHVVDAASGKVLKQIDAGAYVPGSVAVASGRAWFGQYEGSFMCADTTLGTNLWAFKKPGAAFFSSPTVTEAEVIAGARDKRLYCFARDTGKVIWTFAVLLCQGYGESDLDICREGEYRQLTSGM